MNTTDNKLLNTVDEIEKKRIEIADLISKLGNFVCEVVEYLEYDDLDDNDIGAYKDIYATNAFEINKLETMLKKITKLNKALDDDFRTLKGAVDKYSDQFTTNL